MQTNDAKKKNKKNNAKTGQRLMQHAIKHRADDDFVGHAASH